MGRQLQLRRHGWAYVGQRLLQPAGGISIRQPSAFPFFVSLVALTAATANALPPLSFHSAYSDCLCLSSDELRRRTSSLTRPDPLTPPDGKCLDGPRGLCLPPDFGANECRQWNWLVSPECMSDNPPDVDHFGTGQTGDVPPSCSMGWCFVDETNCSRPHIKQLLLNTAKPLYQSYATCGDVLMSTQVATADAVRKLPDSLRVSFPDDNEYRLFPSYASEYFGYQGLYPDLFFRALNFLGYQGRVLHVDIPPQSFAFCRDYIDRSNSSYDACVHSLAVNNTDICVGPFVTNNQRALMGSFLYTLQVEDIYLVVPNLGSEHKSLLQSFTNPFRPFTAGAWIGWFLTLCWVVAVYQWIEVGPRWKATVDEDGHLSHVGATLRDTNRGWVYRARHWLSCMLVRLQLSAEALDILGERAFLPMTLAGKVVSVTLALFVCTMVASYTANLAAVLSVPAMANSFRDISEAIQARQPICIDKTMAETISVSNRSQLEALAVRVPSEHLIDAILNGTCASGVGTRFQVEQYQTMNGCMVKLAGQPLRLRPLSMMSRRELEPAFNLALEHAALRDAPYVLSKDWRSFYYANKPVAVEDPSDCQAAAAQPATSATSLDFVEMAGIYLLVVLATVLSLMAEIPRRLLCGRRSISHSAPQFKLQVSKHNDVVMEPEELFHVPLPRVLRPLLPGSDEIAAEHNVK